MVIISLDSLGESLYKCGYKEVVGKVLMCEILVVFFMWFCGFNGSENFVDLMCGLGIFLIEVVEWLIGVVSGCV